ncbi:glycosyltransferase family 2 protein [Paenibacillus sp. sgz500958]|uniref:glycosyltransferase family 2 protein n=1 Tax=Paenibacillus sp. sgz500958 TaxID=3242475 RepID=UPI0036D34619
MNKTVSVNIVTYNSEDDITDCLRAVAAQDYHIAQVIVIDNASSDQSVARARECSGWFAGEETSRLLLIENSVNTGFAPAHNQAIACNPCDYVLVLNPDVTLAPDYVSRLVRRLEEDTEIGSGTGKLVLKAQPEIVDSTGLTMNKARRAFDRGAGQLASDWTKSGRVFGVSGAAAMYSRRMIEDISVEGEFFDADFFAYKEDVDVAWRAELMGWHGYFDADALGYHERGWKPSGRSGKAMFIRRISYINRYKMIYKNEPARSLMKTLLLSLPYETAAFGYMLLREPGLIKAWWLFFSQLSVLSRKRKLIQSRINKLNNG